MSPAVASFGSSISKSCLPDGQLSTSDAWRLHHPAATLVSSNLSAGMGWWSAQVMDMGRSPWWLT